MDFPLALALGGALAALVKAWLVSRAILRRKVENRAMLEVAQAIALGARAYLWRQNRVLAMVGALLALIIALTLGWSEAGGFAAGALGSALAGYLAMMISVRSNVRVAEQAREAGIRGAFWLAVRGGAVTGFVVTGLALGITSLLFWITDERAVLIALGFGASLISVFARVGGGIYTKAADVGADLVGKLEENIPEDDPRNPAVIADNVGDNVGDCAGMSADLFETYVVTLIASSLLLPAELKTLPLAMSGVALIASIIALPVVRLGKISSDEGVAIMRAFWKGTLVAGALALAGFAFLLPFQLLAAAALGLALAVAIFAITDYYTAKRRRPVTTIVHASQGGPATNIIAGLSVGLEATALPVIIIALSILASWALGELTAVALTLSGLLALAPFVLTLDAFGPITDNAAGIAEMGGLDKEVRARSLDPLDAVGNTTKAVTKGYAIASAGLAALVLLASYFDTIRETVAGLSLEFDLQNPRVLAGLFIGGVLPYLFSAMTLRAVEKSALQVVAEVRRQFREIAGLREGTTKPDYARTVDLVTRAALKEMLWPSLLPVVGVISTGFILGAEALGGFLVGTIVTGLFVAISMTSGGAAWDNAKKSIEAGLLGGKGSPAHKAAVVGDTVGDPYKDTAGPAINPMIKVANIVALLIASFIV